VIHDRDEILRQFKVFLDGRWRVTFRVTGPRRWRHRLGAGAASATVLLARALVGAVRVEVTAATRSRELAIPRGATRGAADARGRARSR
jgi:hypothetical protein